VSAAYQLKKFADDEAIEREREREEEKAR